MSDEQSTVQKPTSTPEQPEPKWGDPISEERQAELQGILDAWNAPGADHGDKKGPFDKNPGEDFGAQLTGAEVFWLAERSGRAQDRWVRNLHLEGAILVKAHLERAHLGGAHLEGPSSSWRTWRPSMSTLRETGHVSLDSRGHHLESARGTVPQ